ncbi:flagellar motor protein MotB [Pseudoruegeria sp. HB172150]|uniref:flagellar motor protein MotB n=1 Tax=Pseudoruegeria sp. HB172150 TaxID=2721164 RepID=UPI001552BD72|nr:flagellar motor protein MotB [Pseudoruegeria sp. HB172150]
MSATSNAPVIIKRKKVVGGDGHHGGAWKVAYADFVTAMMAFFMLMWLLNATTEKQRKGIADYFNPTIPINRMSGGGDGSFGGEDIMAENHMVRSGIGASQQNPTEEHLARGDTGIAEAEENENGHEEETRTLQEIEEQLSALSGESMASEEAARHIVTRVTDEGLIVEVFDLPGEPLFHEGTDQPTEIMSEIAMIVSAVFAVVINDVAVNGYTRSHAVVLAENPVWNLSSDRADMVRRMLEGSGLPPERMERVTGYADRKPVAENPMAARNNRIELILLRENI